MKKPTGWYLINCQWSPASSTLIFFQNWGTMVVFTLGTMGGQPTLACQYSSNQGHDTKIKLVYFELLYSWMVFVCTGLDGHTGKKWILVLLLKPSFCEIWHERWKRRHQNRTPKTGANKKMNTSCFDSICNGSAFKLEVTIDSNYS